MEKTSTLTSGINFNNLFPTFAKKKASLMTRLMPSWTNNKIDSMLFVPKARDNKPLRLPRGFTQTEIKTNDGQVKAYQTGKGPTIVFVHGWGGSAQQFFPLMRGLAQCGFSSLAFDHLGHGQSDMKPATLHQSVATTNRILELVKKSNDGLYAIVGHSTGCIAIAAARNALVRNTPLFLIAPIFNYKLFFLRKLVSLKLHSDLVKQYASRFAKNYRSEYQKLELARNLDKYGDSTVIAHDESDPESSVTDSVRFCAKYPLTKLVVTRNADHVRIVNSESVWQELKSHLNYDDTTINFTAEIIYQ